MAEHRVVVTGLGAICALGHNVSETWTALVDGHSGIGPIKGLDTSSLNFQNGAQVVGFDPLLHFDRKTLRFLDPFAQFALLAASEAIQDARIDWTPELKRRTAVVTGSCVGGQTSEEQLFVDLYRDGKVNPAPLTIPRVMANAACSMISMEFGLTGPAFTLASACSSSNHAISQAMFLVKYGKADLAITGGSEAPFVPGHLSAWNSLRVVAPDTCRPFSRNRRGLILGEGAGMLVLETLESALDRGARIYAELVGAGMSADAVSMTSPNCCGQARAMELAVEDSNVSLEQVDYINAHGTGTAANDAMEAAAIRAVFRHHAGKVAVSSTKSMHGHVLGASAAIEAIATILAIDQGLIPPTINFTESDPECDLDIVFTDARKATIDCALSSSFGFGGLNAVLAFRRWNA